MIVEIPKIAEHAGNPTNVIRVEISDHCPKCRGKRGSPTKGISWDGSRRLYVDTWVNLCGHVDNYSDVRAEAVNWNYYTDQLAKVDLNSTTASVKFTTADGQTKWLAINGESAGAIISSLEEIFKK